MYDTHAYETIYDITYKYFSYFHLYRLTQTVSSYIFYLL
jgi:hypothetical protein